MSAKPSASVATTASIRKRALDLLQSPTYFSKLLSAVRRNGLIGERRNACVIHVVAISALLNRPINVIVKGPSSSGKNFLVSRVIKLLPEEAVREITSSSATAWNYAADDFRHRIVYLQERNDAAGAIHPVRLLISEGRLVRIVTKNEGGQFVTKQVEAEGPIASISTTTRDRIEIDDETRHLSIWVDESRAQTRRIIEASTSNVKPLNPDEIRVWQEAYRLIAERAEAKLEVGDWFAGVTASVYDRDVAARRYFPAYMEAFRCIGLLRSFQDRPKTGSVIPLTFTDFAIATILFEKIFVESLHRGSDKDSEIRKTVKTLAEIKGAGVNAAELAKGLNISQDRAYARLRDALEAGTVVRANNPQKGNEKLFLPTPLPRFVPDPGEILKGVKGIKKPVEFLHPLTGKVVKLPG